MNPQLEQLSPQIFISLLPPAIIISAIVYLVHFFGRAISDQQPYADDRAWHAELIGVYFFLGNILFPGVLGVLGALSWGGLHTGHWTKFAIVIICGGWLWLVGCFLANKVYEIKNSLLYLFLGLFVKGEKNLTPTAIRDKILKINRWIPIWLFSIIFSYIFALEYQSGSWAWIFIIGIEIFINLIFMALNFSLIRTSLPQVDIFFSNGDGSLLNATLIKINDNDIRVKKDDQMVIVNRSQVQKIDFYPPQLDKPARV